MIFADGTRKTVGVIFPSSLVFNTGAPEIMEVLGGKCRVKLAGSETWNEYVAQSFDVAGNSSFNIEISLSQFKREFVGRLAGTG